MRLTSFDVETRGTDVGYALQPSRLKSGQAWVTMCAMVSTEDTDHPIQIMRPSREQLRVWLVDTAQRRVPIVCWNGAFDIAWLLAMDLRDEVYACQWLDGMLLWRHVCNQPEWVPGARSHFGLKLAVEEILPLFAGYDKDIDFETDDPVELAELASYNVKDALYTVMIAQILWERLTPEQRVAVRIEAQCLPMVAEANLHGIRMNEVAARELGKKLRDTATAAMAELKLTDTADEIDPSVLASPTKLRKLLFGSWGLTPVKQTAKGADSTDRDALSLLADEDPRASLLNAYRENTNNATKFADGAVEALVYNGDGMVRPSARIFSTYTGRMTYSSSILKGKDRRKTGYPLHQTKRDKEFRDTIEAPDGYTMMEFDFSGQEFRWMAVMANDATMLHLCQPGEDAHGYMGASIEGSDYEEFKRRLHSGDVTAKSFRQLGKINNLSCAYRVSWRTLKRVARVQFGVILSDGQAQTLWRTYRRGYHRVPKYWEIQAHLGRTQGYVETAAGRRIYTADPELWTPDRKWGLESTSINAPIQGSGADQKYLALAILRDYLPTVDGRFYFELHDGLFVTIPDRYADKAVHEIKTLLSNLPYKSAWGIDLPIQFPVDAKRGKSWGSLEEIK